MRDDLDDEMWKKVIMTSFVGYIIAHERCSIERARERAAELCAFTQTLMESSGYTPGGETIQ